MWRSEELLAGSDSPSPGWDSPSPGCPDPVRHVGGLLSPPSPLYRSCFEEECRSIISRLRHTAASVAEPSGDSSIGWPADAELVTSTPVGASPPPDQGLPETATAAPAARPSVGRCEAASGPARGHARRLPQPSAGGARSGSLPVHPQAPARKAARRSSAQPSCGGLGPAVRPRTPAQSLGCGGGRVALSRTQASLRLEPPKAGRGLGAQGTRISQAPGTTLKLMPAAKTGLRHPSRASQLAQRSTVSKPTPQDADVETAVKVGCYRQPSRRPSTAISTVSARSRLQPLRKLASPKRFSVGKHDQTWMCVEPSFSSELAPSPAPGCGDAVLPEQSAGDQLTEELKHVQNELKHVQNELKHVQSELERVKGELAGKTTQCEACCQIISFLHAQLRATGI
ncbi:uncharacterized protein LJ264_008632 [Porphyrio hochstetteri]